MSLDTYTPEEFKTIAKLRGYAKTWSFINLWMMEHPKRAYTDIDFEQLFRDGDGSSFIRRHCSLFADGQDGQSPQQMPNSWQPSQERILQDEIIHNENYVNAQRRRSKQNEEV